MKFLLLSNGPMAGTGYGVQANYLATRLAADGHEVAIACNFGHEVGVKEWVTPLGDKVRLYPRRFSMTGDDIVHGHANHWFDGDKRGGWIITITDVWAIQNPMLAEYNVAAWAPVDHVTIPPGVHRFFTETGATPVAMSQHGVAEFQRTGLDCVYIPLAVDLEAFKPTFSLDTSDGPVDSRTYFDIDPGAFVVGMVAMNKGWVLDRKGFSEAFFAFAQFRVTHPNAVLFVHTDKLGADGISLTELAFDAGLPESALVFSNQYAYTIGFSTEMMAAAYTAMDVLLAPSHGEGFCVPMLEAQACGTPVIASNATSQAELVGPGWLVEGQPTWDQSQRCTAFTPHIAEIVAALEKVYVSELEPMQEACREFAARFAVDTVYDTYWRPFITELTPPEPVVKPVFTDIAVVVPVMKRPQNVKPLVESFHRSNDGTARLYFVVDPDDSDEIEAIQPHLSDTVHLLTSDRGQTYAAKANVGYRETTESAILLTGDDVELTPGCIQAARELSDRFDIIGTNDAPEGKVLNPEVAAGRHADHFFIRRTYIEDEGSCLEGPGVLAPEAYNHFYTDKEIIGLARARAVFTPCLTSRVIHHRIVSEEEAANDVAYQRAAEYMEADRITFVRRLPLIEQQRVTRGR